MIIHNSRLLSIIEFISSRLKDSGIDSFEDLLIHSPITLPGLNQGESIRIRPNNLPYCKCDIGYFTEDPHPLLSANLSLDEGCNFSYLRSIEPIEGYTPYGKDKYGNHYLLKELRSHLISDLFDEWGRIKSVLSS